MKLNVCHLGCKHGFLSIQYSLKILPISFSERVANYSTYTVVSYTDTLHCVLYSIGPDNTTSLCNSGQFACLSGECLPALWQCDGDNDCADATDEVDCGE